MSIHIHTLTVGDLEENCYVVHKEGQTEALIIDPGANEEKLLAFLSKNNLSPVAVLLTHGHFDHTGALNVFSNLPIYIGQEDNELLLDNEKSAGTSFGDTKTRPSATHFLTENCTFSCADMSVHALHTPGHTKGGFCYIIEDEVLLTGDTLFQSGYGRTDLYGGNMKMLMTSLRTLLRLEKDYPFYPGHGAPSSIFTVRGKK